MKFAKILCLLVGAIFLFGCGAKEATPPPTRLDLKIQEALEKNRGGEPTGPISLTHRKLSFDEIAKHLEMDEKTAKLHLKSGKILGYYSLIAKNYPPDMEFILYNVSLNRDISLTKAFIVNGSGVLISPLDDTFVELENNFLFFSDYLPGEPIEFVLASRNGKYLAATRIIPNPIEVEDERHRKLTVEIASPNKREYIIHGSGFKPCETYMLITRFENEKFLHTVETDHNGELLQLAGPTAPWVTGGAGSIELKGEDISRPMTLNFQWGA